MHSWVQVMMTVELPSNYSVNISYFFINIFVNKFECLWPWAPELDSSFTLFFQIIQSVLFSWIIFPVARTKHKYMLFLNVYALESILKAFSFCIWHMYFLSWWSWQMRKNIKYHLIKKYICVRVHPPKTSRLFTSYNKDQLPRTF